MRFPVSLFLALPLLYCTIGCRSETDASADDSETRFTLVAPEESGLTFNNVLTEGPNTNILMYEYFYNGGGVAAADFNQDGWTDLYFTSNLGENRLFLNRGDLQFEDVTSLSQTAGRPGPWKTGVTVVDINADERPDLYVAYSGMLPAEKRQNQLFINEGTDDSGVPRFREAAAEYGLNVPAFSNQGYFFDYDGDEDLDLLLLNHNPKSLPILNAEKTGQLLQVADPERGLRLYRNDEGAYHDVTEEAGINGSPLSYGLGLALSDINRDGLPDFYLSNDYEVPDYLYLNNGDGTFTDQLDERLGHTSHFSMGNDIADVNNDGLPDIFTLDMLPADNRRRKLLMADDNRSRHDLNRASGFPEQTMRNMLHLNRGDGTFAEIGQLAGVSATDWSWSALLQDFDNDGWKDLHVTNGYLRDYTNMDFIKYMDDFVAARGRLQRTDVLELLKEMPASDLDNYLFHNRGGKKFTDVTEAWGLGRPSNSNGAVAVDLDNDGDLDLVVSNLNQPAFLYRNTTDDANFLQVDLRGEAPNTQAVGTKVTLKIGDSVQVQEYYPNRGYLSSGPPVLHFGLGAAARVESLRVQWPNGLVTELPDVTANQRLTLRQSDALPSATPGPAPQLQYFAATTPPFRYTDEGPGVRDFDRQPLLPRSLSSAGPVMETHDLDGNGQQDIVVGGKADRGLEIHLNNGSGYRRAQVAKGPVNTELLRVTDLAVADFNRDDLPDIYVAYGGYGLTDGNIPPDCLLLNQGNGSFTQVKDLPLATSTGTVAVSSPDPKSGYPTVFVGGGVKPGSYPLAETSQLLVADSDGTYQRRELPDRNPLSELGLTTDAAWLDLDGDGREELIVVGEWMPVTVLAVGPEGVSDVTARYFDTSPSGWWNSLLVTDLNGDGQMDLLLGNEGLNNQFAVSAETPATLFAADQDRNGSVDPLFSYYIGGVRYPDLTRDELVGQLAKQRVRFPDYQSYSGVTADELEEAMPESGIRLRADRLETTLFLRGTDGKFRIAPLPPEVQYAPVHAVATADINEDGFADLILAGNETKARLRYGSSDANLGMLLLGKGDGSFSYVPQATTGLQLPGSVRALSVVNGKLLVGVREGDVLAYSIGSHTGSADELNGK